MINFKALNCLRYLYTSANYQKITVKISDSNPKILFIKQDTTVQEFKEKLKEAFKEVPNSKVTASLDTQEVYKNKVTPIKSHSHAAEASISSDQKSQPTDIDNENFLQVALFNQNLSLTFINEQKSIDLPIGFEVTEYNYTNNRNLPQIISRNIIELNQSWQRASTLSDCFNKNQIFSKEQADIILSDKQITKDQVISQLYSLQLLDEKIKQLFTPGILLNHKGFVNIMISGMLINWAFLFGVTYGQYGWDTGEPLAYLTSTTFDLLAFAGIFGLEVEYQKMEKQISIIAETQHLNLMRKMIKARLNFHLRRLI